MAGPSGSDHDRRIVEIAYTLLASAVVAAAPLLAVTACSRLFGWSPSGQVRSFARMLWALLVVVLVVRAVVVLAAFERGLSLGRKVERQEGATP